MHMDKLSWKMPVYAFPVIYLFGFGFSFSNNDGREIVELFGIALFLITALFGIVFACVAITKDRRIHWHAALGLLVGTVLAVFSASYAWAVVHQYLQPGYQTVRKMPDRAASSNVWIDTDPACGFKPNSDVDDCWALVLAFREKLPVIGISTVFGNAPIQETYKRAEKVTKALNPAIPVFIGHGRPRGSQPDHSKASMALADALRHQHLTILALGPLTNIANVIVNHPELTKRIDRIVMVAGKRPGHLFHPGKQWWYHFRDFNICMDTPAGQIVMQSDIPLTLIPFELGSQVAIGPRQLVALSHGNKINRWLYRQSAAWLAHWQTTLRKKAFSPFDSVAVGYLRYPDYYKCMHTTARIGFNLFLEPFGIGRDLEILRPGRPVTYCYQFKKPIVDSLIAITAATPAATSGN